MTSRQRVTNALLGKPTDKLVWAPLVDDYYLHYLRKIGFDYDVSSCCAALGTDVIYRHANCLSWSFSGGVETTRRRDGNIVWRTTTTPVGNLIDAEEFANGTSRMLEYAIKTREDIKIMQYITEHTNVAAAYDDFIAADKAVGERGIATVSVCATPLAHLFEFVMGLENFVYFLEDYPSEMAALMDAMHESNKAQMRIAAKSPALAIFSYEDTSSTTISYDMYKKYCLNQLNDYADICKNEGKLYFVHMCGKLTAFSDLIAAGRMDGIDSCCPPSTGDIWPWDAAERFTGASGEKVIIGGIDPTFLCTASAEELEAQLRVTISKIKNKKVILSTGDATAAGTPMENIRLVSRLVDELGRLS